MAIQLRRGDYAYFDPSQLLDGELAIVLENDPNTDDGTGTYVSYGGNNVKRLIHADESVDVDVATTETAGIVKPDGTSIRVDADGTIHGSSTVVPSSTAPLADGTASAGSSDDYARGDHRHPTDTSRASASDLSAHTGNGDIHVTASDKAAWNGKADESDLTAHTGNTSIHVSTSDRTAWNAKANATDLTDHVNDTTVHITSAERTSWNGKADESALTAHTGSSSIHVTTSDKARWNGKADAYPATSSTIGLVKPDGTSTTVDADGTFHAAAGTPATENTPGIVKPDNQTVFVDNGVLYASRAGEGVDGWPGIVQPDGETLSIGDDNILRVPYASSGQYGVVMPDGDTTKVDGNGYLYVPVADSSYPGIVKPDGETIDVDSNGTLSVIGVGGIPEPSSVIPQMDGMGGSPGSSTDYARGDHVHPTDTSRASASDLTSHTGNTTVHVTAAERTAWNAKASTSTATTSANGLMSASDKSKLDGIESGANAYELPAATTSTLGGVKADGTTIHVDADGTIHGAGEQTVPLMSPTTRGGAMLGHGLAIEDGALGIGEVTDPTDAGPIVELTAKGWAEQDGTPSPSYPQEIKVCRGRNLLDAQTFFADLGAAYKTKNLQLAPNTTYVMSTTLPKNSGNAANLFVFKTGESGSTGANGVWEGQSRTVTTGADGIAVIGYRNDGYTDRSLAWYLSHEIQLELGSTAHPYVPYGCVGVDVTANGTTTTIPIPLPSRGWVAALPDGTADTLTLDGAGGYVWTLNVGETIPRAVGSIFVKEDYTEWRFTPSSPILWSLNAGVLCSHLRTRGSSTYAEGMIWFANEILINSAWPSELAATTEEANAWLAQNTVTILYPIKTPVIESGYVDMPIVPIHAAISSADLTDLAVRCCADEGAAEIASAWGKRYESRIAALEEIVSELVTAGA
jgi:hypothetical protein